MMVFPDQPPFDGRVEYRRLAVYVQCRSHLLVRVQAATSSISPKDPYQQNSDFLSELHWLNVFALPAMEILCAD